MKPNSRTPTRQPTAGAPLGSPLGTPTNTRSPTLHQYPRSDSVDNVSPHDSTERSTAPHSQAAGAQDEWRAHGSSETLRKGTLTLIYG